MKQEIEILQQIESYVRGELSETEIDYLWTQFLKNPEYYNWFEIMLMLTK